MKFTHVAILAALLSISMSSISPILPVSPHTPQSSPLSPLLTNNARDEIKPFNCISKMCLEGPSGGSIPLRLLAAGGTKINRKDYGRHGTGEAHRPFRTESCIIDR